MQGRLVFFDDEEVVGLFMFHDVTRRFGLGMHGIGGHHGSGQRQRIQQGPQFGNFIGFLFHFQLSDHDRLFMQKGTEEVGNGLTLVMRPP
jgi:hypothetical protein